MKNTAYLSSCRTYRYALWRTWDDSLPIVQFIGLNPSTADEKLDDPTLIRCINFAKSWGYGGVCTSNLFAYRATDPQDMKAAEDPIGPDNDQWLLQLSQEARLIIAAWGNHGTFMSRSDAVKALIQPLHCLKMNRSGEPAHPLYQPAIRQPIPMD